MVDVCIIGAGTAGLTAAIYAARAGKSVLVFEKNNYGGQIVNAEAIENYPGIKNISGYDFANGLYEQAMELGMKLEYDCVNGIAEKDGYFKVKGNIDDYDAASVIIASGVKRKKLGISGEEKFTGMGVSYCAICDGMFFRKREVIVVGGGNTAFDDVLYLSNYCSHVYLMHRRDTFRGEKSKLNRIKKKENVSLIVNATILSVNGSDKVASVSYRENDTGSIKELMVDGIFVAVGQSPDTEYLNGTVALDAQGYVNSGEDCHTDISGIFVAGDCRSKEIRQLTTASADGTVAALAACKYLENIK